LNSSEVQAKLLAPRERGIILVDVVGYSRYDALGQAATRILDLGKQAAGREQPERAVANTVFFGGELQPQMTTIRDYLNSVETTRGVEIHDLGSQTDKHGVPHSIYWLTNPTTQLAIAFDSLHGGFQPVYFRV